MHKTFHHVLTESQWRHQGAVWHGLEIWRHVTIGCSPYLHHCVLRTAQSEDLSQARRVSLQTKLAFKWTCEKLQNWCIAFFFTSLTILCSIPASPTGKFVHSVMSKWLIINPNCIKNSNYSRIIFPRSLWDKEIHCFVKLHLSLNLLIYSSKPQPSK